MCLYKTPPAGENAGEASAKIVVDENNNFSQLSFVEPLIQGPIRTGVRCTLTDSGNTMESKRVIWMKKRSRLRCRLPPISPQSSARH
jgi:hypothetical protein